MKTFFSLFISFHLILTIFGGLAFAEQRADDEGHLEKIEIAVSTPEIKVTQDAPVRLDEVISVTNMPPEQREAIGQQILFTHGNDGDYESGDLLRRIRTAVNRAGDFENRNIQYSSPDRVSFLGRTGEISQNQIAYRMMTAVMGICRGCRVHSIDVRLPKVIPTNWKTIDAKLNLTRVQRSNLLPVDLLDENGDRLSRIYLQVDLGIEKKTLVAARSINRGELISDRNTRIEWKVWDGFSRFVDASNEVIGKTANQNFTEGTVLLETQLSKERLVAYGEPVKIVYIANSFEISSQGISMESGGQGDMVRVKTSDQKKDLVGLVTHRGVVQIQ